MNQRVRVSRILVPAVLGVLMLIGAYNAAAVPITADTYFTVRSNTGNTGPGTMLDATQDGGLFLGFLTNTPTQVDRTHWEFDMALIGGPVTSATLDFSIDQASSTDTIFIESYSADGVAMLSDFIMGIGGHFNSFSGTTSPVSIDITAAINANLAASHIGFAFSIDPFPQQAFFAQNQRFDPMTLNFSPVPEPGTWLLMGSGLIGLVFYGWRKRKQEEIASSTT